jgi:hypothetical protein
MRNFLIVVVLLLTSFISNSQSLGYQDLATLFSSDDVNGTARFTAMSGAFGALGGDVSVMNINPAGLGFYNNSYFAGSLNSRNTAIQSNYYGNARNTQEQLFNFSQVGAVFVFDSAYKSDWGKFVLGFNYKITKDFTKTFDVQGNSGTSTFQDYPLDNNIPPKVYNIAQEQRFDNNETGALTEFNVAFSSVHKEKLYLGASLIFYDLNYSQRSTLLELNADDNGNTLDAHLYQENITAGKGFSLNVGFIYKVNQNFRFGLSYQTPTVFSELLEESNILDNRGFMGDTEIIVSEDLEFLYTNNIDENGEDFYPIQRVAYSLKTPSKITASAAFIFGKNGLLSIDYSSKNYTNTKLSNGGFSTQNRFFQNELKSAHALNIGSEWRFENFSFRGGYRYEQSPYKLAIASDNLEGYSFGGGYNFGKYRIDISFSDANRTAPYNFYAGFDVNAANIITNNKVFTATLVINL